VAGVDEAGRGAWAGPIVAAAVMLPVDPDERRALSHAFSRQGIVVNDSKKTPVHEREIILDILGEYRVRHAVAIYTVDEIDSRGIGFINAIALRDAALNLELQPEFVLSDAFRLPEYAGGQLALIKGDCRSRSIALASTVAKVTRDRLMVEFDRLHPGYGFARHKGYGTAEHRRALEGLGPCAQHRRSFAPIRLLLGADGGC
jgi:ribonuclease HII